MSNTPAKTTATQTQPDGNKVVVELSYVGRCEFDGQQVEVKFYRVTKHNDEVTRLHLGNLFMTPEHFEEFSSTLGTNFTAVDHGTGGPFVLDDEESTED